MPWSELAVNAELIFTTNMMFLATIPWGWWVWWRCFAMRNQHERIKTLFWVQSVVMPMYSILTFMLVFGFGYPKPVGLFCWSVIDALFMATDLMMSRTVMRLSHSRQSLQQQVQQLQAENTALKAQIAPSTLNAGIDHGR